MLPIRTPRLALRAYRHDDADASFAYYSRPEVTKYLPWGPWTRDEAQKRVAVRATRTAITGPESILSLVIEHDGALVGDVVLWPTEPTLSRAEVGWAVAPSAQGRGIATEAVGALLDVAFDIYGMHRVVAHMHPANIASHRVAERVGMVREGHLRQNVRIAEEWVDSVVYGMLATDRSAL